MTYRNEQTHNSRIEEKRIVRPSLLKTLFSGIDFHLMVIVIALSLIGVIFSYSSQLQIFETRINPYNKYIKQIFYLVSGLALMWMFSLISYKRLAAHSHILYVLSILLLVYTLIGGTAVNQSRRWISLGFVSIQPSEFAKVAMIIYIANYLNTFKEKINTFKHLSILVLLISLPIMLIILQPDLGTAIIFFPVILTMVMMIHIRTRYLIAFALLLTIVITNCFLFIYSEFEIAPRLIQIFFTDPTYIILLGSFLFILAMTLFIINFRMQNIFLERMMFYSFVISIAICLTLFTYYVLLRGYQKERLLVFLNPQNYRWDLGYNVVQSKVTIGSGGLFGKGLFNGTQSQLGFLPSKSTDFVFAVIAEELGFVGAVLVLSLFLFFLLRLTKMVLSVKDYLGGIILAGILMLFFIQILINIGMTVGLMPVTGLPLPFLSAGGSTLWSSLIAIGIACNIFSHRYVNT